MSDIAIKFENISKQYRLGLIGTGTILHDINRWWYTARGKEDPYLKIGEVNDRASKANSKYVWALKDITFDVKQGEVVGIIGKNGAGKSTLLKILSRVTSPTTGSIKAKGRIASLLEVGTGFHPELTGRENIFMNGSIMGMNKAEIKSKMDEIVDFAGVERYIDTPVKRYSSGMTVRLGFAIAAHLEPEILVVDEVLAVGDAEFQKKAIGKMQDVSRGEGRTVLFVSHNMTAVKNLCKRGVILKDGGIFYDGSVHEAIDFYIKEQEERSLLDLDHINRQGNGLMQIKSIEFINQNREKTDQFFIGEPMRIKIDYIANDDFYKQAFSKIDIGINDIYGQRVLWLSSNIFADKIVKNKESVTFIINELLLTEGTYNINIYVDGSNGVSDHLTNVLSFSVIFGDYYKTGREIPKGQGYIVSNYRIEQ